MSISDKELPLSGNAELILRLSNDFCDMVKNGAKQVSNKRIYIINCDKESTFVERSARKAALKKLAENKIKKIAIDTRRLNQESQRNPRKNLQYWHRSDLFINDDIQSKINVYSKLFKVLNNIKESYGSEPEYHDSYARVLRGHVERALRVKEADKEYFAPHLSYLEQLLDARYRLTLDDIKNASESDLKLSILKKDENLVKRGLFLNESGSINKESQDYKIIKGQQDNTQQNIIEAIFGNNNIRRDGEKKVQRTITITISDEVKD